MAQELGVEALLALEGLVEAVTEVPLQQRAQSTQVVGVAAMVVRLPERLADQVLSFFGL